MLILGAVFVMSALFGMTGVWLAYAVAEGITNIYNACNGAESVIEYLRTKLSQRLGKYERSLYNYEQYCRQI